uniref:Integrin alpha-2 domain-containing protein n=1 Tax=Denticeps clupeoides TaxID=299321 RepID=A0AAY4ET33_9TELE
VGTGRTLLLASCAVHWMLAAAFNLETGDVVRKAGEPGSLFGFSLAMHRQLSPAERRMVLIGAPRAKALNKQRANVTGGLYSCELTSQHDDCTRIDFDNEVDPKLENKENQWMGVSVQSQGPGGKIVTCAHRYQRRRFGNTPQESRDIIGRCYVLSQDLTVDLQSDEDGGNWKFCEGRARGHERFGSCQQGLAATFTKDYHYVVFGAPGAYNWKGIVRVEQKNNTLLEMGLYDDGPYEVGDEHSLDPVLVPVPANSYLGFSLDSGHNITKKGQLTIVSGAPRTNHSGAVVLLKKAGAISTLLAPEYILEGPGLASSFGYDVAVVDLNRDGCVRLRQHKSSSLHIVCTVKPRPGWQDIVVGAPQFFLKDGEVGGAVYIYINEAGKWDSITPSLEGKQHDIKLFGYSLAGNMDLDHNSYPDIAVGSLSDAVFIYRARPVISIKKDVKVNPKQIDLSKKTCGNNICLTVEACFTYKANPASFSPKLTIAFLFEAESERRKQGLPSRVTFLDKKPTDQDFQSTGTLDLRGQNKRACVKAKLKLQENIKDKLRGIPVEVSVAIQSTVRGKRQSSLPQLVPILDSADSSKVVTEVHFLKEGCGTDNICQSNLQLQYQFCYRESNQDIFTPLPLENGMAVISLSDQKDIAIEVKVNNRNGDDAHEARLVGMFPDSLSYSAFRSHRTQDKQVICVANQNGSQADCELGNPFKRDAEVKFYIILSTAGISLSTTEIEVDLLLETTSQQETLGRIKAKAKVVIELLLSVSGVAKPSQVYFGGAVKGESAMKSVEEIGSFIEYEFRIINLGKPLKSFGTAFLNIQWPKENAVGKWMLYLVNIKTSGLEEMACSPESEINPLKLIEDSKLLRKKRETQDRKSEDGGLKALFSEKRKHKTLTCSGEVKCVEIKCPLQGLDSSATVLLRSRLWNATFLEDYALLNYLDLIVKASLSLDVTAKNIVLKNADTQVRLTVFPENTVAQFVGVPWWIILVAILAGILMLALLVILLWKCGFFKRAQKDQYDAAYHKAEIHAQPSDKEKVTTDA